MSEHFLTTYTNYYPDSVICSIVGSIDKYHTLDFLFSFLTFFLSCFMSVLKHPTTLFHLSSLNNLLSYHRHQGETHHLQLFFSSFFLSFFLSLPLHFVFFVFSTCFSSTITFFRFTLVFQKKTTRINRCKRTLE